MNWEWRNMSNETKAEPESELLQNLEQLHTTESGVERIWKNLPQVQQNAVWGMEDAVAWCREKIESPNAVISRRGKNWYVEIEDCILTVNAYSYTIITAHKKKEGK